MRIESIVVGDYQTNCYILDINNEVLIIDPGDESNNIINMIGNRKVLGVLVTHTHEDHIGAIPDVTDKYKCPIYDRYNLDEGEHEIGLFKFDVIYTPGHIDDQIVFYFKQDKIMFVGDFIFKQSIGRTDLPKGDDMDMKASILKILEYPKDIKIYPGHGESTTLGAEENTLKYFFEVL